MSLVHSKSTARTLEIFGPKSLKTLSATASLAMTKPRQLHICSRAKTLELDTLSYKDISQVSFLTPRGYQASLISCSRIRRSQVPVSSTLLFWEWVLVTYPMHRTAA